jgi:hypothetical protein
MFSTAKCTSDEITLEEVNVNSHSQLRTRVSIPQNFNMFLVRQVEKNGKPVDVIRGIIQLSAGYYGIFNIYENRTTGKLHAKLLTALTETQLRLSRNMNCGRQMSHFYRVTHNGVKYTESFFSYEEFRDFLNHSPSRVAA